MKIKSNATPSETFSPFFEKHQTFCHTFERFIASKNGKVKGTYNAWTYLVEGRITTPQSWSLLYKRSVFSGASIWLSSTYQNLFVKGEWVTTFSDMTHCSFKIRKRKRIDFLRSIFNKKIMRLPSIDNYVIVSEESNTEFISKLTILLAPLFLSNEVYKITFNEQKLVIDLRTESHHFDVFEKLIQL